MSYGVTVTGFVTKALDVLKADIETAQRSLINSKLALLATNVFGQINTVFADRLSELWDLSEAIYRSQYPDSASAEALDQVCSYTGVTRLDSTPSELACNQMYLDAGVLVPAGSVVSVGDDGARFVTLADVENTLGRQATLSADTESESDGPVVGLAGTVDTIQTPISGWLDTPGVSSAMAGPWFWDTYIEFPWLALHIKVDGVLVQGVHVVGYQEWLSAQNIAGQIETLVNDALADLGSSSRVSTYYDGEYVRITTQASQGSLEFPETLGGEYNAVALILGLPFDTLTKGFNSGDAELGTEIETDAELRPRREGLLRALGTGTADALRARLLEVTDVVSVTVLNNPTDFEDANGIPPHSFEAVVRGGDVADIAACIWQNKILGIQDYGAESQTVVDSMGVTQTVHFSRPTEVPIYIDLELTVGSSYPIDGAEQVKGVLVEAGDLLVTGESVIALKFKAIPLDVAGVIDVPTFKIDIVSPPVNTGNLTFAFRELPTFDASRISVTVP